MFLVFSIEDTEILSDRPKNFLCCPRIKEILNCHRVLCTIPPLNRPLLVSFPSQFKEIMEMTSIYSASVQTRFGIGGNHPGRHLSPGTKGLTTQSWLAHQEIYLQYSISAHLTRMVQTKTPHKHLSRTRAHMPYPM